MTQTDASDQDAAAGCLVLIIFALVPTLPIFIGLCFESWLWAFGTIIAELVLLGIGIVWASTD